MGEDMTDDEAHAVLADSGIPMEDKIRYWMRRNEDMTKADAAANEAGRGAPVDPGMGNPPAYMDQLVSGPPVQAVPDQAPSGDESVGEAKVPASQEPLEVEPMTCPECLGTGYLMCPTCEGEGNVDSIESESDA